MISDFQWALGGVAVAIIIVVLVYNRWQESKYKRRAERAFSADHPDVLIDGAMTPSVPGRERVEPRFDALPAEEEADDMTPIGGAHAAPGAAHPARLPPVLNAEIDAIALVLADAPIEPRQYELVIEQSKRLGNGVHWEGLADGLWQPISLPALEGYRELRAGIQLADRRGAIDAPALAAFNDMVAQFAAGIGAVSQREEVDVALARAQRVDAFCADTDIEIAVNVVGKDGATFAVTRVRGLAESNGMAALESGEYVIRDDRGNVLLTLRNIEPAEPAGIKRAGGASGYLTGLTFALDVPRTADADRVFERMFALALKFADMLHGEVVDDNRKILTANGRRVIADTIVQIMAKMEAQGIAPGGGVALRLYA
ncbi:MAG TPA: cell division protein ZipA C-terminal FtsZ-binding domain-containing protein [Usitatibacteraceae bacterium]